MLKFWKRDSRRRVKEIQKHLKEQGDGLRYIYTNFNHLVRISSESVIEEAYNSLLNTIIDASKSNKEYLSYFTKSPYNPLYERITAFASELRDRYHEEFKHRRERR